MTIWTLCSCSAINISLLVPCAGNQDGESKLKIALGFCNKCLKQPSWDVHWKYLQVYAADSPTNYQCARVAEQGNRTLKEAAGAVLLGALFTNVAAWSPHKRTYLGLQKLLTCRSRIAPSRTDPPIDQGTPWLEVFAATPQTLRFTPPLQCNVRAHFC